MSRVNSFIAAVLSDDARRFMIAVPVGTTLVMPVSAISSRVARLYASHMFAELLP